jgi:hypothetical protein
MLLAAPRLTVWCCSMLVTTLWEGPRSHRRQGGVDSPGPRHPSRWPQTVRPVPVIHEERAGSSIRLPSDLAAVKPGTEILLVGHARHPAAYADARWVDVTLAIEGDKPLLQKSLRVFGPRQWHERNGAMVPGDPAPYRETPLRWEWAFGGSGEARNPIGRGASALRGHRPTKSVLIEASTRRRETDPVVRLPGLANATRGSRAAARRQHDPGDLAPHPPSIATRATIVRPR